MSPKKPAISAASAHATGARKSTSARSIVNEIAAHPERRAPVIAIANHKGGAGKTTTTVNIAAEFGRAGLRVLTVDLDAQANTSKHIGKRHPSQVAVTLTEVIMNDESNLSMAIDSDTTLPNVSLIYGALSLNKAEDDLSSISPRPSEILSNRLESIRSLFDVIILDCPPSLRGLTVNALAAATHLIIPVESGSQYALYGVSDLLNLLRKVRQINPSIEVIGALLLKHDERRTVCHLAKADAIKQIGMVLPISISSSTKVSESAFIKSSVHGVDRTSKPAREFRELAEYLQNYLSLYPSEHATPEAESV